MMIDGGKEAPNASSADSSPLLNPKLVTHRENIMPTDDSSPRGGTSAFGAMSQTPSGGAAGGPREGKASNFYSSPKDTSQGSVRGPAQNGPAAYAAGDFIEKDMPPCRSAAYKKEWSNSHIGSRPGMPQRSYSYNPLRSTRKPSMNSASIPNSPRAICREDSNRISGAPPLRLGYNSDGRLVPLQARKLSENAYVSQVLGNLFTARVPPDHVPRCAQNIPERYKYHPPPSPPPPEEASPRLGKRKECSTLCARSNGQPIFTKERSERRKLLDGGLYRSARTPSGSHGEGVYSENAKSFRSDPSLGVNTSLMNRGYVMAQGRRKNNMGYENLLFEHERSKYGTETKEKQKEHRPLVGLQRALLFDNEPPSQNLEAPLSTAQAVSTPARQPELCTFFRPCQPGEVNNLEEDSFTDRRWSANTRHIPLGGEHGKNTAVRSLTFPLSAMEDVAEEEETVLIQPVSYFNEDNFVEERDVALWYPQQEKIWLHEDGGAGGSGEYSQRSVTSCQTKTTKAMMLHISDPGAPTKEDRRKKYISSDTDENSTPCIGPTSHRHSYLSIENNSVSFPCDSSAPSRITPLEEAGESIDLANHLSHLAVAGSPTQKRLLFTGDVDCPTDPPHLPTPLFPLSPTRRENYKGLSPGMQLLCRGKRFLDEMDTNRDPNSSNSTTRTTRETHRKFRRIDIREGGNRVSSPRREKYRR